MSRSDQGLVSGARELARTRAFPTLRLSASMRRIVRRLAGRLFRKVRSVIGELEALKTPSETDEASLLALSHSAWKKFAKRM